MSKKTRFAAVLRWHEMPLLVGLVLLWMALWRETSWLTLISGILVSLLAMRIFYLPPVEMGGRFNLWWMIRYLLYFFSYLVIASFQVAWLAVRPGPPPRTSIIRVPLATRSDFLITAVSLTVSLIPGSLVVEADRFASTLYLHVLNTPGEREIERARSQTKRIEELLIRAIGSHADLEAVK